MHPTDARADLCGCIARATPLRKTWTFAQMAGRPIRVLFLCTGNACRSQLAEGLLRHYGGNRFEVHSAGYLPSGVHSLAIQALQEVGIDASRHRSKHWNEFLDAPPFDFVITLCDSAARMCPAFPQQGQRLHWPVEDPITARGTEEARMVAFRAARDRIAARIRQFVATVAPD